MRERMNENEKYTYQNNIDKKYLNGYNFNNNDK